MVAILTDSRLPPPPLPPQLTDSARQIYAAHVRPPPPPNPLIEILASTA